MTASISLPVGPCWLLVPFNPENAAQIDSLGLYGQPVSITDSVIARMPDLAREAPASAPPPRRPLPPSPAAAGDDGKSRRRQSVSYELLGEHRTAATANDAFIRRLWQGIRNRTFVSPRPKRALMRRSRPKRWQRLW